MEICAGYVYSFYAVAFEESVPHLTLLVKSSFTKQPSHAIIPALFPLARGSIFNLGLAIVL